MGFGGTDAPPVSLESPEPSIAFYSFKRAADDIKELARQLGAPKLILGGHDWVSRLRVYIVWSFDRLIYHAREEQSFIASLFGTRTYCTRV